MKSKKNKKSRRQKDKPQKKCIIVTSEQVQAVKETIKESGQAVFLGATITAVSLFGGGCGPGVCKGFVAGTIDVARTPNTPVNVLAKLAKDADKWVRASVGKNPSVLSLTLLYICFVVIPHLMRNSWFDRLTMTPLSP